jgi:hypothetical protein
MYCLFACFVLFALPHRALLYGCQRRSPLLTAHEHMFQQANNEPLYELHMRSCSVLLLLLLPLQVRAKQVWQHAG